ncbi:MAG TPA: DUF1552 domain-containing protein [Polyangia bacterium]|jgi:hypothetical protein|nr:DUF1552 domain-containing protein [Polyangia bacterium]
MKNALSSRSGIRRRTFLGGGIGAGLASMFLRQLEADADSGPPTRFLVIHRPCGTIAERFFPTAGTSDTDFTLGPIMAPLQALKGDMVVFNNLTTPRDGGWQGDRHGQGMICSVAGNRGISDGTPIDNDDQFHNITSPTPSVDQLLLAGSPRLKGSTSIHLGSYRDSVQGGRIYPANGAANFRPISYAAASTPGGTPSPTFPEVRPDVAAQRLFGPVMAGGSATVARQQAQNKSILDLIAKDLGTLQKQVPASQRPKLDAHLTSIEQLEAKITATNTGTGGPACLPPTVPPELSSIPAGTPAGIRIDALDHQKVSQAQLNTIKVGFQCDLLRVATFTYGHGNSDVQFQQILPSFGTLTGYHDISHATDSGSVDRLAAIDTWYSLQVAAFLTDLKNTPESDGSSMLDNTLVFYFSEVSYGATHLWDKLPVVLFGGKSLGLQRGRNLQMNGRYLNDVQAAIMLAFGYPLPADNKFAGNNVWKGVTGPRLGQGAVDGLFA